MIRELSPELRSKIAAGEVIERPVSVVKELVENSLDAGANVIKVSVVGGGLTEIVVEDNGSGISFDELPAAVRRFTTSKIASEEDLEAIQTLGFRGEALASIADVSELTIYSSDGQTAGKIVVRGGHQIVLEPIPSPRGTRVIVRDLFFNFPARRKFLRSSANELSQIRDFLKRMVLLYPHVHWVFATEKGTVWNISPQMSPEERFYSVFQERAQFRESNEGSSWLHVYFNPRLMGELTLAVNGHLIRGSAYFQVLHVLRELWHGANLPVMVLSLWVDPADIDVNVHPQKQDIRFKSFAWVRTTLSNMCSQILEPPTRQPTVTSTEPISVPVVAEPSETYALFEGLEEFTQDQQASSVSIVDYLFDTFLLVKRDGAYEIWDQHAVNEKINYTRLTRGGPAQYLLEPVFIDISDVQAEVLTQTGFDLQKVRGGYFLRAVPRLLLLGKPLDVVLSDLGSVQEGLDKIVADLACKSSVKAGQPLSRWELEALVSEGLKVAHIAYDPHGRPAIVRLDKEALGKLFGR
ncbi:DNA mismatch repair endonuclease MutL [Coprothermobacteraceae bacterium]|nr:DNA mismatch repair endonuclease MutL [Coprothermobacteraceae bacterium]